MKNIEVLIIQAFSRNNKGGNPAGVVLNADVLDRNQKQSIASKIGVSETAFISGSEIADFKLDFFTPVKQIAHCGHATIAAFSFLKQEKIISGHISSKETIDGIRQIYFEGDMAFMEQEKPRFLPISSEDRLNTLAALGLVEEELLPGREPEIVNTGNSFLIIPVEEQSALKKIVPDMQVIESLSRKYNLIGFYCYAHTGEACADVTARMFAPYYGIPEEAATGMAAGPLACYLDKYQDISSTNVVISQGEFMTPPSPSKILVRLEKDDTGIRRLFAGGSAYLASQFMVGLGENEQQ
ncbi:MAG: PhzF family phenazine biosynthesis protein [Lewinellaceae bacterium]|nr:PhzF family phenazine biosynthesis protein [Phaeodactylibacter sp.]MCB9037471.1 PhzF family phenazine biosynthesis protein [Lewinellaceae bacterium]